MELQKDQTAGNWIWLNPYLFPDLQNTFCCHASKKEGFSYGVAEFQKKLNLKKPGVKAEIKVSGDTFFRFWLNDTFIGKGPVCGGGDFRPTEKLPRYFLNRYLVPIKGQELNFFAQVQLSPVVLTDYSRGHGGFMLSCTVTYEDGTSEEFKTDESWQVRVNYRYKKPYHFDNRLGSSPWKPAVLTEDIWQADEAPIPMLEETEIFPSGNRELLIPAHSRSRYIVPFAKIYAGYVKLSVACQGNCFIHVRCCEVEGGAATEEEIFSDASFEYRGLLHRKPDDRLLLRRYAPCSL